MGLSIVFLLALVAVHASFGDVLARTLGMAGLAVWCALRPNDDRRIRLFLCALGMLVALYGIACGLDLANRFCFFKYDLYLHAIDHTLGFCPSQLAARLAAPRVLWHIVAGFYQLMPTMMVAAYGWTLFAGGAENRLLACYAVSASSVFLYMIVPSAGPVFVLGPTLVSWHPSPPLALIHLGAPANCIPSVHMSTAILIWLWTRRIKAANTAALVYVFITAFATLALGEHYLIDLVLSFPFVVFVVSAVSGKFRRSVIALLAVLCWLFSIRLATGTLLANPGLLWSAAALTVALSCAYFPDVARAESAEMQAVPEQPPEVAVAGIAEP
jgi:hypothetical protein